MAASPQPAPASRRARNIKRSWKHRYAREFPPLQPEQLRECRLDPAWEARNGIIDRVVCRECGVETRTPLSHPLGHFRRRHPDMNLIAYDKKYPGAPLSSIGYAARFHGLREREPQAVMAEIINAFLTPNDLQKCRKDPVYEKHYGLVDVVVCRICGLKLRSELRNDRPGSHLRTHPWCKDYFAIYPEAPSRPKRVINVQKQAGKDWRAKVKRERAELRDLKAASGKLARAEAAREALPVAETVKKKLAEPDRYMWMSANEVAEAFGIHRATFYRNVSLYRRLRKGPTGAYLTSSVVEQLNNPPKK